MPPPINVSEVLLARLQKHAIPLVDTFDTVIAKMVDSHETLIGASMPVTPSQARTYLSENAPDLTFTKVLSIELNGTVLSTSEANWNALLDKTVILAAQKLKDPKALQEMVIINHALGKKEGQGYRHLPEAGISIQGQDANGAWKGACHILKALHIPVRVIFVWANNPKASHPGTTGKFEF